jgi:hypothetical protein
LGLGNALAKACIVSEAMEATNLMDSDSDEQIKPSESSTKKRSMMTADAEKEHLEKMVTGDDGVAVFRDDNGVVQTRRLAPKAVALMRKSTDHEIDFWSYDYWCNGEPMTVEEYIKWHEETGLEAEWMSSEGKDHIKKDDDDEEEYEKGDEEGAEDCYPKPGEDEEDADL